MEEMKKLFLLIVADILGLWLAVLFVPGVVIRLLPDSNFFGIQLTAQWQLFLILGAVLGLLNFFIKPILNLISLPLRIITLGAFSLVVNMAIIWLLTVMFREFSAPWLWPLLWTTIIIWALNLAVIIQTHD